MIKLLTIGIMLLLFITMINVVPSELDIPIKYKKHSKFEFQLDETNNPSYTTNINKKWTWMFYDDADFSLGYDPFNDFVSEAYSNTHINTVILQDTFFDPAYVWYINENQTAEKILELGELNMGDGKTLDDFISFAKQRFPAERYVLSIYNHGNGWLGSCIDDTNGSMLSMDAMKNALLANDCVNLILFTAPCLMSSVESMYELRDCTDVYIASEDASLYTHWQYCISDIFDLLNEKPNLSTDCLGDEILSLLKSEKHLENFRIWMTLRLKLQVTLSAINSDNLDDLTQSIDTFALSCLNSINLDSNCYFEFENILGKTKTFKTNPFSNRGDIIDLYDFAQKCADTFVLNENIVSAANDVLSAIDTVLINEHHGLMQRGAHGININFPQQFDIRYNSSLDFVKDTHWDEFIHKYYYLSHLIKETDIDQYQLDINSGAIVCNDFLWAQSFVPNVSTLTKLKLPFVKMGNITSDIDISIRKNLTDTDLTSVSKSFINIPIFNIKWLDFDFPDITVTPGEQYYILCYSNGGDNSFNYYKWMSISDDVYEKGDAWIGFPFSSYWQKYEEFGENQKGFDFCFKTYGYN